MFQIKVYRKSKHTIYVNSSCASTCTLLVSTFS